MIQKKNKKIGDIKLIKKFEMTELDKSKKILYKNNPILTQFSFPNLKNNIFQIENSNIKNSLIIKYNHLKSQIQENSKYKIKSLRKPLNKRNLLINIDNEVDKEEDINKNNSFNFFTKRKLHKSYFNNRNYTFDNNYLNNSNMVSVGTNTNNEILFQTKPNKNSCNKINQKELIFKRLNNKNYFVHHYKILNLINSKREEFEAKRRIELYKMYKIVPLKIIQNKLNYKDYFIEKNGIILPKNY